MCENCRIKTDFGSRNHTSEGRREDTRPRSVLGNRHSLRASPSYRGCCRSHRCHCHWCHLSVCTLQQPCSQPASAHRPMKSVTVPRVDGRVTLTKPPAFSERPPGFSPSTISPGQLDVPQSPTTGGCCRNLPFFAL